MEKNSYPTIRQIAEETGFSKSTVSAALRNNSSIAKSTRLKIREVAIKMGYKRDDRIAELMGYLSEHKRKAASSPIFWLNDEEERNAWKGLPWYRNIFLGAQSRAHELGYQLDELWCREPGMNRERIVQILKSRGIRGAVLTRPHKEGILTNLKLDFCACAQVLCDPWNQTYHVAVPEYYYNINLVIQQLKRLGYKRPGLTQILSIIDDTHDLYSAGYLAWKEAGLIKEALPVLKYDWPDTDVLPRLNAWLQTNKPDVVICHDKRYIDFIQKCGFKVPEDIGIVHLNLADDVAGWSGIDPNHRSIGAASIDLVVNQIHRNETGHPDNPYNLHIKGHWRPGKTTKPQGE